MEAVVPVHLAVEDTLSEAVLRRVLLQCGRDFAVGVCYQHGGFGYLKTKIRGFNQAARGTPFLVLTDLDKHSCPPALIADWLPVPRHANLLFRVAVREIESWVMADRQAFSSLLGVRSDLIPANTDELSDAKKFLMDLVRRSRKRELHHAILPLPGSTAKQGRDYNGPLIEFIEHRWKLQHAARHSPSLKRTCDAIRGFQQTSL